MAGGTLITLFSFRSHLMIAFLIRVALIFYGDYHDRTVLVKYTDIDYKVFTDAARHLSEGGSPYERHTYRYTPLLAWMLLPNISLSYLFGKFLFSAFDIFAGQLIYAFVKDVQQQRGGVSRSDVEVRARVAALAWLYNPLVLGVSTRGNAEAVICTLVLVTLHLFRERVFVLAGCAFGLAIHFKIYPIIYSVSFFLALSDADGWRNLFEINMARIRFVIGTVFTLAFLTLMFYYQYGDEFLDETYLYHITRKDIRHNFSPYFYMLYLTVEEEDVGISVLTFLPQALLLLAIAKKFANFDDLPFCLFCQTVVFVSYNKVITSQYFLWYISLLPLNFSRLRFTTLEAFTCLIIWLATQASWLLPAYYLEFQGSNTFQVIWMESLAFFIGNVGLLSKLIRKYREVRENEV